MHSLLVTASCVNRVLHSVLPAAFGLQAKASIPGKAVAEDVTVMQCKKMSAIESCHNIDSPSYEHRGSVVLCKVFLYLVDGPFCISGGMEQYHPSYTPLGIC